MRRPRYRRVLLPVRPVVLRPCLSSRLAFVNWLNCQILPGWCQENSPAVGKCRIGLSEYNIRMKLSAELLHKYVKAGPRYTSYPTAPYFNESFGPAQWEEELRASQDKGRDISLYAHIPFCDTLCYYCGCNMIATKDYSKAEAYLEVLFKEIDRVAALTSPSRKVRQLHWGGGTPTYLKPDDIRRLYAHMAGKFTMAPDAEIGCEMDPRELTRNHVKALRESGFNRLSLGVQDLTDQVQVAVNRVQPEALIREVYGWIREEGFESVNFDLMIGLPHQTPANFEKTLDKAIAMGRTASPFNYAHVPRMKKHQKLIVKIRCLQIDARLELQKLTLEKLTAAGYVYIGMDHFVPDDEIVKAQQSKTLYRNFQATPRTRIATSLPSVPRRFRRRTRSMRRTSRCCPSTATWCRPASCRWSAACASRRKTSCAGMPSPRSCATWNSTRPPSASSGTSISTCISLPGWKS